ncbi:hypothetical protein A8C32_14125 [Flavivirga aquatica]|uniref:DUF4157 domain-containing protein n=1 Tax=Flavivirga aquatica TaxID=1849968 RepID=A0A1E5TCC6_9FLAO|nr:hypothetical protein [Flavivirga aquatica]OEK09025.1 hypothetical protein A8C32_14125 [Flavivirga aquatica]
MIFVSKYLVPKDYNGITIFPFILLKSEYFKKNCILINHERIHLRQQLEMLVLPFYLIYGLEFLIRFFQYKKWDLAYRNISFEREAYAHEVHLNYLKQRPFWSFLKYLRRHGI